MIRFALAFLLGILVAEARWRRRIKRALAADDADWARTAGDVTIADWPNGTLHAAVGYTEPDDGLPPLDPYLDWLTSWGHGRGRTSGSVTVDPRDGGSNVWTS